MYCFLDMDGVIVDFVGGVCKAHNRKSPYLEQSSYGVWDMEKLWGISVDEFWQPTEYPGFWRQLEPTTDAEQIVKLVTNAFGLGNIAVLTAPSDSIWCVNEKREWMKSHFPALAKNMIFTSAKRFLAGEDRVLVDDRDKNIDQFSQAGGQTILVPRLWNRKYEFNTLDTISLCLSHWGGSL